MDAFHSLIPKVLGVFLIKKASIESKVKCPKLRTLLVLLTVVKLVCELGAGSWELGKREQGVGIDVRVPKLKDFY
jgi:hypothetical protein